MTLGPDERMQGATCDHHTVRNVDWDGAHGGPGCARAPCRRRPPLAALVGRARGGAGRGSHLVLRRLHKVRVCRSWGRAGADEPQFRAALTRSTASRRPRWSCTAWRTRWWAWATAGRCTSAARAPSSRSGCPAPATTTCPTSTPSGTGCFTLCAPRRARRQSQANEVFR